MHLNQLLHKPTLIALLCLLTLDFVSSLRDVHVQVPHAVRRGEKVTLKCLYDLEGDSLYSVKWYKGRREFYSFTPKETPAIKVFQFTGIKVERAASNESQLVLEAVNMATTGKFSCEVSADAPSFHTLISAGELEVVEVPGKDPVITGIRPRYRVGDIVRGNCTARHSRPAANLTWTINGYETNPSHVRQHKPLRDARDTESAISGIHFVVTPQHFSYGKLKIRCTAHIHDVYWKSTEKSIEEDRHKHNSGNSINLVNNFSDDYFDLDDENLLDRSDTYMTHIKGDVSSLNASGGRQNNCVPMLSRFATLTLLAVCALQQLQQLWRQLFRNDTTITTTTAAAARAGEKLHSIASNRAGGSNAWRSNNTGGRQLSGTSVASAANCSTKGAARVGSRAKRHKCQTKTNENNTNENCVLIKRKAQSRQQQQHDTTMMSATKAARSGVVAAT